MREVKEIVQSYFHRLLNEKDLSVCDKLLSSDYVDAETAFAALRPFDNLQTLPAIRV